MATQTTRVTRTAVAGDLAAAATALDAITGVDAVRQIGATAAVGGSATEVHWGVSCIEVDVDDTAATFPDDIETSAYTVVLGYPADADRDDLTDAP